MRRLTLRGLSARGRRSATIVLAVFLGVGLMAGGLVLTDTINASFEKIFSQAAQSSDVVIRGEEGVEQTGHGGGGGVQSFDASVLAEVRATPGVRAAQGGIFYVGSILDDRGDPLGTQFAPSFIFSAYDEQFESLEYLKGKPPTVAREVAIDAASAKKAKVRLRDEVTVVAKTEPRDYEVVGLTRLGDTSFGGASFATLELKETKRITGREGMLDRIEVAAEPGIDPTTLAARLERRLPAKGLEIATAQEDADDQTEDIKDDLGFLTIALAVFGFVALFVGSFVIFNTFSITVAQRVSEFGMLRTIGASRRQILLSVLFEAAVVGVIGSVAGLFGGIGFAFAIDALFGSFGIDLPNSGTVILTRTIVVGLGVGMLVTILSALVPAVRATRVSPMAALREEGIAGGDGSGRIALGAAVVFVVAGLVALVYALFGNVDASGQTTAIMGGGAVAILFGVALISPRLVRPIAAAVGRPIQRITGFTGRLARENSIRKPGRTAATAAALMIGLGLVSFVTIFAAGFSASVRNTISENFAGELIVQNIDGFSSVPRPVVNSIEEIKGIEVASPSTYANAEIEGVQGAPFVSSLDPKSVGRVFDLDWVEGSDRILDELKDDEIVADAAWAESNGLAVGDTLAVKTASGEHHEYTIRGSITDNADLFGAFVLTEGAMDRDFGIDQPAFIYLGLDGKVKRYQVQFDLKNLLTERFPSAAVRNQRQLGDDRADQIGQLTNLIYALLSLAVVVSLFGIANTLSLSVLERTRELGMLRAIGAAKRQVRRIVTLEAVITALIGAVLGLGLGVAFAALMSRALADEGFVFTLPVVTLAILFALAALAGALSAVLPARRAANIDVLRAVSYE